jgi:hypothetical protein
MISAIDFFHDKAKSIIDRLEKSGPPNVLLKQMELGGEAFTLLRTIIACTNRQDEINAMESAIRERLRQIVGEGFDFEADFANDPGELASAGATYGLAAADKLHPMSLGDGGYDRGAPPPSWPFGIGWWKPTTPRRNLEKGIALMLAELQRLDIEEARDEAVSKLADTHNGDPVPMVLHCPKCGVQHIDESNEEEVRITAAERGFVVGSRDWEDFIEKNEWLNPPHKTHQCQSCKHEWRPFDYATTGVEKCDKAPDGWMCSRAKGHGGPCAAGYAVTMAPRNGIPDECAATGSSCSYAPEGPKGEMQCRYCGKERAKS